MVEKERTDPKENEVEVLALRLDYLEVILVPGKGGEPVGNRFGGGGGGIIVNGRKPGSSRNAGEGFGGGGAVADYEQSGFGGCVLIELN